MHVSRMKIADAGLLVSTGLRLPRLFRPKAPAIIRAFTKDGFMTYDRRTIDSTGAFLVGELEKLDPTLHEPLVSVNWSRDIDLREDVTVADEVSSFTNSSFASAGGITPSGKAWLSKDANAVTGIALDIGKTTNPLYLWAMEIKFTIPELESAMKLGRSIDTQKYDGMQLKHNMDVDEMVYVGDSVLGKKGLVNSDTLLPAANVTNVAAGGGGVTWTTKTPDEILFDVNTLLNTVWESSGYAVMPSRLLLPPKQFSYIVSQKVSNAGNMSILNFLRENSMCNAQNGKPLDIFPTKWLVGAGVGGTIGTSDGHDRMVAYTKDHNRVRYPMTILSRTPIEYRSLFQITTYWGRLGVMEFVYPETVGYADGL